MGGRPGSGTGSRPGRRWVGPLLLLGAVALLALVPPVARGLDAPFYLTLVGRIMIFAIAALSLDLILGFGGLVSFGHAAYLGVGVYAVGILSAHGVHDGVVQWPVAVLASAAIAAAIGTVSLRTSGVYFIMITLAFAQMLYFLGVSLKAYGGDDGMTIAARSRFGGVVDLEDATVFYYLVLGLLVAFHYLAWRLVHSRFGLVIRGCRSNERRMRAIGFPTFRYKLTAFVLAGTMCGIAGVLLANFTKYMSPAFMHWTRSGEIMVMVILGGMGTVFGPALGAFTFLLLEEILAGYTEYWPVFLGPILVLIVLFAKRGLFGLLVRSAPGG
jgi:branched-chain amino acid transport system permease protein